jgi:hypothetical protein
MLINCPHCANVVDVQDPPSRPSASAPSRTERETAKGVSSLLLLSSGTLIIAAVVLVISVLNEVRYHNAKAQMEQSIKQLNQILKP